MSGNQDKTQRFTFIYPGSQRKITIQPLANQPGLLVTGQVLKAQQLGKPEYSQIKIRDFSPVELIAKRIENHEKVNSLVLPVAKSITERLQANVVKFQDLQSRIHFLLKEIEEIDPKDKS